MYLKMNMDYKKVLVMFLVLIFLAGCKTTTQQASGAYVGGTNGLKIEFVESEPPDTVLDANSDQFYITLRFTNQGEHDLDEGDIKVTLDGISKQEFQLSSLTKTNENTLIGSQKERTEIIAGDEGEVSFEAKYKPDLSADFKVKIGANVCYQYETETISSLCLEKDVSARVKEKDACTIDQEKTIQNSAAPIQISNLKERPIGTNKIKVTFDVENKGLGTPFEPNAFAAGDCYEKEDKKEKVQVRIVPGGSSPLKFECSKLDNQAIGVVRLIEGKASISCEASTSGLQETPYESPLNIYVDYTYKDYASKEITVEDSDST